MKFGVRLTVVAASFVAMFGVLGIRLWFVQVAEGAQSAQIAEQQTWVRIDSQAPRGDIVDRTGVVVATSRLVPRVVIDRRFVEPADKEALIQRLSGLLGLPAAELDSRYEAAGLNGRFPVTEVSTEVAYRISEQLSDLPGVSIEKVPVRVYLTGPTMAHVIGHLGLPDTADLEERPDLDPNLRIGKLGVERVYDAVLQGQAGFSELRLNRQSEVIEESLPVAPVQVATVQLTLDLRLQEIVEQALEGGVVLANSVKDADRAAGEEVNHDATKAAAVVLDITNGEILALASVPDFDPSLFISGVDVQTFQALNDAQAFNNLGNAQAALGRDKEAVEAHIKAVRLRPDYAEAFVNLGAALRRYGRLEESLKALREAIRILPEHPRAHANLGATLTALEKFPEAAVALRRAMDLQPDLAEGRYLMGILQVRLGDRNAAFEEYKKLQELDKPTAEKLFKEIYG